jgi:hypothetical protein
MWYSAAVSLFFAARQEQQCHECCFAQKYEEDHREEDTFIMQTRCHKNLEKREK